MFVSSIFNSLFPSYGNPADKANPYYKQVPDVLHEGYDPYVKAGADSMESFQEQLRRMSQNPTDILDDISSHYEQSPTYQNNVAEATKAAKNAAAAGGQAGSPATSEALARKIAAYSAMDQNDYINHSLGIYEGGVNGLGQMTQTGYNASTGLADSLANSLMSQGNLRYTGEVNKNQQKAANSSAWMNLAGAGAGLFF